MPDQPNLRRSALADLGTGAVLAVAGGFAGVIGVAYATSVPLGAVIAFVGNAALGVLGGWGLKGWRGALWPAVGWFIAIVIMSLPRSEGDVMLPSTTAAQAFLFVGAAASALAAVVAIRFQPPREQPARGSSAPGPTPGGPNRR